jgi:hypothetical protein
MTDVRSTGHWGPWVGRKGAEWWPSRTGPQGPLLQRGHKGRASLGQRPQSPGSLPGKGKRPDEGETGRLKRPRPSGEILFWSHTAFGTDSNSFEDILGVDASTGAVRRLTGPSQGPLSDRDPAWSPDRNKLVFMSADAVAPMHLQVFTAAGAPIADLPVEGTTPAWLDDSTVVCSVHRPSYASDRADLVAVDVSSGAVYPLTAVAPGHYLGEPAWHPSSGLAAILTIFSPDTAPFFEDQRLVIADTAAVKTSLAGGPPLTRTDFVDVAPGMQWCSGPAWSPDGSLLAFSAIRDCATRQPDGSPVLQGDLAMHTMTSGAIVWLTDDTTGHYDNGLNDGSPAFSPDGQWLAWVRGHEDDWNRILVRQLNHHDKAKVLLNGGTWHKWGLSW